MSSVSRPRRILALFFIGTALFLGWQVVWLFVEVAAGHGSPAGNILRIACSLLLFAFSVLFSSLELSNGGRAPVRETQPAKCAGFSALTSGQPFERILRTV